MSANNYTLGLLHGSALGAALAGGFGFCLARRVPDPPPSVPRPVFDAAELQKRQAEREARECRASWERLWWSTLGASAPVAAPTPPPAAADAARREAVRAEPEVELIPAQRLPVPGR